MIEVTVAHLGLTDDQPPAVILREEGRGCWIWISPAERAPLRWSCRE
jgi:hypothetical protein